jgi:hypothetical protein
MAWIESHQELGRHPKTRKVAKALGISRPAAIGHLHYLWWWAMDFAQDGDITEFDNDELAEAALFDGDPVEFFAALESAGFVDTIREPGQDARAVLHDWEQYAGRLVSQRKANAERQRAFRDRHKGITETPCDHETERNDNVTVTPPLLSQSRNGATVQDRTVPDRTEQNKTEETERGADAPPAQARPIPKVVKLPLPSEQEVSEYFAERGRAELANGFWDYWQSIGWKRNGTLLSDWKATVRTWISREDLRPSPRASPPRNGNGKYQPTGTLNDQKAEIRAQLTGG